MSTPFTSRFASAAAVIVSLLILTGCFSEAPVSADDASVNPSSTSTDPRLTFLVEKMKFPQEAISVSIDTVTRDTTYYISPVISEEDRKRGVLTGGLGFKQKTLDEFIERAKGKERALQAANEKGLENGKGLLAKKAHTRWDHWTIGSDVKILHEVHDIKVFIPVTGYDRLGPNWQAGIRLAIANWNAEAKGTAVSFVETLDSANADLVVRGSFGLGLAGTDTHMAFPQPHKNVDQSIQIFVNTGFEYPGVPLNQKATNVMSLFFLALNVMFVGGEGGYWNFGDFNHIPGTPWTEGDPWTPGSSVLTMGSTSYSTPHLSAGDLTTLNILFPYHGNAAIQSNNQLTSLGGSTSWPYYSGYYGGVERFEAFGDTLIFQTFSGELRRKIRTSISTSLWTPNTSSMEVSEFIYKNGTYIIRTKNGSLYGRTAGNTTWIPFAYPIDSNRVRFDGNRILYAQKSGSTGYVYSRTMYAPNHTLGIGPAVTQWSGPWSTLIDIGTQENVMTFNIGGDVWAVFDNGSAALVHNKWSGGPARKLHTGDDITAIIYKPSGSSDYSYSLRHWPSGTTTYYTDPIAYENDLDVCGNKLAYMTGESRFLWTQDYDDGGQLYNHENVFQQGFSKVRLSGPNCDYITVITGYQPGSSGSLYSKYGIGEDTYYTGHFFNAIDLSQRKY